MKTSDKTADLIKAMSKFQSGLTTLVKDTQAFKYKYVTIDSIWESFRPMLDDLGLVILQEVTQSEEGHVKVMTRIQHTSDQWIETEYLEIPAAKRDPHTVGSCATYGRRYSLSALLGIVTGDDDDGAKAQAGGPAVKKVKQKDVPISTFVTGRSTSLEIDTSDINEYLEARADHKNHSVQKTVNEVSKDLDLFEKNIRKWLENKENSC